MSLKFTNEPPQGIRASLKRTYADITQDTLDYSNHPSWPMLLYAVAFLHTVVQVNILAFCIDSAKKILRTTERLFFI